MIILSKFTYILDGIVFVRVNVLCNGILIFFEDKFNYSQCVSYIKNKSLQIEVQEFITNRFVESILKYAK